MMSFYFPCVTTYTEKIKENFQTDISHEETGTSVRDVNGLE